MKAPTFLLLCLLWMAQMPGKTPAEKAMERQGMVDVLAIEPSLKVDLMYSRADNFTGRILYKDIHTAYLHPAAASALRKAQTELRRLRPDLSLKVYDAARPMSVQQEMYNVVKGTPQAIYVSNPRNGGGLHNYGLAVDVTLCHAATGDTLPMGVLIDHMSPLSHIDAEDELLRRGEISAEALANRRLLRRVMRAGGFRALRSEWWHFNLTSRANARKYYQVIK